MKKSESRLEKVDEMISNYASKQSTKTAEPYQVTKICQSDNPGPVQRRQRRESRESLGSRLT